MTFDEFLKARHIPGLDGLRAISVGLVVTWHTGDSIWQPARGYLGVTLFFVISGFLITTLLLREENSHCRVSLWRFYTRRLFRITPLYFFTLLLYGILVFFFHVSGGPEDFVRRFLLLVTFNGEFAGSGTFSHAWSLGIEEKFYILWPVLGFAVAKLRSYRIRIAYGLLVAGVLSAPYSGWNYIAIYVPIIAGVIIALSLNNEYIFGIIAQTTKPLLQIPILLTLAAVLIVNKEDTFVHISFGLIAALALPSFVLDKRLYRVLEWRPLAHIGKRAYGIYLFHIVVLLGVSRFIPRSDVLPQSILRFVCVLILSLVVAEVMARLLEDPMIRIGRRLTSRRQAYRVERPR